MRRRHVFKFAPRIPHLVSTVKDDLFRRFKKTHTRARDGRRRALLLFSSVAPHEVVPARAPRQHVQRVRRLARLVQPTVQPHHRARNELFRAFIRQLDARASTNRRGGFALSRVGVQLLHRRAIPAARRPRRRLVPTARRRLTPGRAQGGLHGPSRARLARDRRAERRQ